MKWARRIEVSLGLVFRILIRRGDNTSYLIVVLETKSGNQCEFCVQIYVHEELMKG